jgi:hypothetical protein
MIVGNVQYVGKTQTRQVVYPDRIDNVKKNEWVSNVPLNKCKELVETGDFIPDLDTQKLFDQFSGNSAGRQAIDGMLKGKRVFIIGSGASLKGFDFSILDSEFTIAVNHTVIYYPNAKAVLFLDANFLDKNNHEARKFLKGYKGMVFCSFRTQYQKENINAIPFYVNNDRLELKFNRGIWGARLSGLAAVSLALIMQAEQIYLLGYDLKKESPIVHFYDEPGKVKYDNAKGYGAERLKSHIKSFNFFDPYKEKIFNLSANSDIPNFKFKKLEEVI